MRSLNIAAMGLAALSMAADPINIVEAWPMPEPRRRAPRASKAAEAPHAAKFIGDGFDHDRLEAAARKRARKAARLSPAAILQGA